MEDNGDGRRSRLLLRCADQGCLGALLAVSLIVIAGYWLYRGGHRGRLIEIDQAEPLTYEFQVDINSADWPELTMLPDVGETLARRIVESRDRDGPFVDHADLLRVSGIGPKTLGRISPYLLPIPKSEAVAGP